MKSDDLQAVQDHDILQEIQAHQYMSAHDFAMKYGKKKSWPVMAMAEQISARKKLAHKLPAWVDKPLIIESEALQQSSSQWTAEHKAHLYVEDMAGGVVGDLCAGLGVDLLMGSEKSSEVHYNDISQQRADMFRWNADIFEREVSVHCQDAQDFLSSFGDDYFDLIYCDPSRRQHDKRVVSVHACTPNIITLADLCRQKSRQLLIKLSPSITESSLAEHFPGLRRFIYLSLDGERKESLALIDLHQHYETCTIEAHCLYRHAASCELVHTSLSTRVSSVSEALVYIYDPDPAIIAAGLLPQLCQQYGLQALSSNHPRLEKAHSVVLTHNELVTDFPAQVYQVLSAMPFARKPVRKYLRQQGIDRVQIIARNSNLDVSDIRRVLQVKDGGNDICLCALVDEKVMLYHLRHV